MMNGWLPVYGQPAFFVLMVSPKGYILKLNRNIPDNLRGANQTKIILAKKSCLVKSNGKKIFPFKNGNMVETWLPESRHMVEKWQYLFKITKKNLKNPC